MPLVIRNVIALAKDTARCQSSLRRLNIASSTHICFHVCTDAAAAKTSSTPVCIHESVSARLLSTDEAQTLVMYSTQLAQTQLDRVELIAMPAFDHAWYRHPQPTWLIIQCCGPSSQKSLALCHGACYSSDANLTAVTQFSSIGVAAMFLILKSTVGYVCSRLIWQVTYPDVACTNEYDCQPHGNCTTSVYPRPPLLPSLMCGLSIPLLDCFVQVIGWDSGCTRPTQAASAKEYCALRGAELSRGSD